MNSKPPAEIESLIKNHIDAFNSQNVDLFRRVFAGGWKIEAQAWGRLS